MRSIHILTGGGQSSYFYVDHTQLFRSRPPSTAAHQRLVCNMVLSGSLCELWLDPKTFCCVQPDTGCLKSARLWPPLRRQSLTSESCGGLTCLWGAMSPGHVAKSGVPRNFQQRCVTVYPAFQVLVPPNASIGGMAQPILSDFLRTGPKL